MPPSSKAKNWDEVFAEALAKLLVELRQHPSWLESATTEQLLNELQRRVQHDKNDPVLRSLTETLAKSTEQLAEAVKVQQ